MRILTSLSALALLSCGTLFIGSAGAQDTNTYLYIAHAASGRNVSASTNPAYPIDISANGVCIVKGESFGEILGPFTGLGGAYNFAVTVANTGDPCSGTPVYTAKAVPLAAATTYFAIVTLDASNNVNGQIYGADLSSIPAGWSRIVIANATGQNLTAALTRHSDTNLYIAADTIEEATAPSRQYSGWVYLEGTTTPAAGPLSVDVRSRDLYFYVLAGSASNDSVQILGPKVIRDVF